MDDLENTFSWSFSRHGTFRECPRKYWFNYYGAWEGWSWDAPEEAQRLYRLKKISNLHLIAGDVVHRAIERLLTAFAQGETPDPEETVRWCKGEMQRSFDESRKEMWREDPKRFCRLHEHHYGPPPGRPFLEKIAKKVGGSVRTFFQSPTWAFIRSTDPEAWLPMETLDSFEFEGIQVFAMPDFACRHDGRVVILDWKTGRSSKSHRNQVILYTLFAEAKWEAQRENVRAAPVYLQNGADLAPREVSAEEAEVVRDLMRVSIREMRSCLENPEDLTQNVALRERYPPRPGHVCRGCRFREACPEGL